MQVRVLGCSGSIAAGSRTTSFLVDDELLVDAGTGVGDLTLAAMTAIDDILVTHSHLDHVLAIGLLADSVTRRRRAAGRPPVRVHALPQTLAALRTHIFNDVIWPDFTRLPDVHHPVLRFVPIEVGQVLLLGRHRVEVLPAEHTVPAVGYAVWPRAAAATDAATGAAPDDDHDESAPGAWVFTGDTGPNPALWARLARLRMAALVIETAFRDDERDLAHVSRHLCPAQLERELAQLARPTAVYITHIKPGEVDAVMAEIGAHEGGRHRVSALVSGQVLSVGG